jgi:hypothetical protein
MKIYTKLSICAILLGALAFGCSKKEIVYDVSEKLSGDQALLKINYESMYFNNRSVFLRINDQRVSGLITNRTPFPGGGSNTNGSNTPDFLAVPSGSVKLTVSLPYKVDNGLDSITLYSTTLQLAGGKNYVAHITDTAATTKTFLTEEDFTRPDTAQCKFRFVNLMPNVPSIDLYYGAALPGDVDQSLDTLKAANVGYLQSSPVFLQRANLIKYWKIRPAGAAKTSGTIIASYTSATTVLNQRVYTAFATGYTGKTAASQKPYIAFFRIR